MDKSVVRGKIVVYIGDRYAEEPLTEEEIFRVIEKRTGFTFKKENGFASKQSVMKGQIELGSYGIEGKKREPSMLEIKRYILSQPQYKHNVSSICDSIESIGEVTEAIPP